MNLKKISVMIGLTLAVTAGFAEAERGRSEGGKSRGVRREHRQVTEGAKLHKFSTTVEKERPELNEATKKLIAAYRRDPSEANRAALEKQVRANYEKVLDRKRAKLEELKRTAREESKVKEMEVIVEEMLRDREHRIAQSMARFADKRLRPGSREGEDGFHPLIGAAENVSIAHTEVTNAEYKNFKSDWPFDDNRPVVNVSYSDAVAYCDWLTTQSAPSTKQQTPSTKHQALSTNHQALSTKHSALSTKYRLPTEDEWELAAGHMPKDADFNSKGEDGKLSPVDAHKATLGACGGIDFWGNAWEWTSTERGKGERAVKGGSWSTPRTLCRTECRTNSRDEKARYADVGFRIVRVEDTGNRR